jgi:hypothetical protein
LLGTIKILSLNWSFSPVCEAGLVDIIDEHVLQLSLKVPKHPEFPVARAWLKSEAGKNLIDDIYLRRRLYSLIIK